MPTSNRRNFLTTTTAIVLVSEIAQGTASKQKPIKVGQIGTQHAHASGKLAALLKYPDVFDVVGVVEPDDARRKRLRESGIYAEVNWLTEAELLEQPDVRIVAVETEIDQLLPVAERCIRGGKHIHLDKPAGTSLDHFKKISSVADQKNLALQMGYMFRGNPAFQFMFDAVKKGWLGDVFQIHCEMSKKVNDDARAALAQYPGGSMFELGCHLIDAVVTVLGPPDKVTAFNRNSRPDHDDLMDNCLAVFEYPTATASIRSTVAEVGGGGRRQFVVCGTRGSIVIQPLEPHRLSLTLETDTEGFKRGTHQINLPAPPGRYDNDLLHLARVVNGSESEAYDRQHDIAVQESVLRASGMFGRN